MLWFFVGLSVLFACFLLFTSVGLYSFRHANLRRRPYPTDPQSQPRSEEQEPLLSEGTWERWEITSFDGLLLRGIFLPAKDEPRGMVLLFHGYHSSWQGNLSEQATELHEKGYHLLLVSQRAHNDSEGRYICFGAKESRDVLSWCRLAEERFPSLPLFLFGISMGGASVVFSGALELPNTVRGIVADCPFSSPFAIIRRTLKRKHKLPPIPLIYFMNAWSRLLAGFDYRSISMEKALKKNRLPILLIHGTDDAYVPAEMSESAAKIDPSLVTYLPFPGAAHCEAVRTDPEKYWNAVHSFFEENL